VILYGGGMLEMSVIDQMKLTLLSDVKAMGTIRIVISAAEELPKHRIVTAEQATAVELP